jgi:hypothetical protein
MHIPMQLSILPVLPLLLLLLLLLDDKKAKELRDRISKLFQWLRSDVCVYIYIYTSELV